NQDFHIIEIEISSEVHTIKPASTTTPKTTTITTPTTTASPAPTGQGAYCDCGVDKFGFPSGWNYNDLWVDIVVILDTSEALGEDALEDAETLIESFISDGFDD
ncbi:hypothetical protein PENTCL1PPCAC_25323, partial [Pristionchus entomophagus]